MSVLVDDMYARGRLVLSDSTQVVVMFVYECVSTRGDVYVYVYVYVYV